MKDYIKPANTENSETNLSLLILKKNMLELIYGGVPWFHNHFSNIVLNDLGPFQMKAAMSEIKKNPNHNWAALMLETFVKVER